jgi:hypothetical protein
MAAVLYAVVVDRHVVILRISVLNYDYCGKKGLENLHIEKTFVRMVTECEPTKCSVRHGTLLHHDNPR